ncbi:HAD family hydrolase [Paenibacillus baekrokdamisoli]|uniref:HAD family hydrolase n=1 Tax=Paenibacillus baekrokdamisoli TaxID=1712516 RepID=UPI001C85A601|nr:HAD family hydrolase [Paenibacillus baekrokdamisoli]
MKQIKYIFFDCMETLVDLYELPSHSDYAYWAFSNSGVEHYWSDFEGFLERYSHSKRQIAQRIEQHEEYELMRRIEHIVDGTESIPVSSKQQVVQMLYENYWRTYKSQCFVKEEVKSTLLQLSKHYKLAVVSNFMINDGIEELLELNNINGIFEFIVTSINMGWRKPSARIYDYAIQRAGCNPEQILFVGDDYENDYLAPRLAGMKSILLDKEKTIVSSELDKVSDFYELKAMLVGNS